MSNQKSGTGKKNNTWTPERTALLIQLFKEGLSAAQIAAQINARLGGNITRNAVIGKLYRLGLSGRGRPASISRPRRQPARPRSSGNTALKAQPLIIRRPKPQPRPRPQPRPIQEIEIPVGNRVTLLMLKPDSCRWPHGDPGTENFSFCGRKAKPDCPYCEDHAAHAYQPNDRRRR